MAFTIPNEVFTIYREVVDELLTNINTSNSCTVYYPPLKTECSNCTTGFFGGISKNVYRHGGPAPFEGMCPLCGGNSYLETENTDTLRLRIYWSKKDWLKIGAGDIPQADVMVIGWMADLPKIERMNEIQLVSDQNVSGRYRLSSKPRPWGFGKDKYFISFLVQV